jgi:hypothetical protein
MARKKIVAPTAPRIVPGNSRRNLLGKAVLIAAAALLAWLSYDYGRSSVPAAGYTAAAGASGADSERVAELEQERQALLDQIAELKRGLEKSRQALEATRARMRRLQPADAPVATAQPAAADTAESIGGLKLENMRISATASDNVFKLRFSVMREGGGSKPVTGTIWIAVNGVADGEPTRLSFKKVSPEGRPFVKMNLDLQQDVNGEMVLPPGFRPRNVLIEAKPYDDKYKPISTTFDWSVSG